MYVAEAILELLSLQSFVEICHVAELHTPGFSVQNDAQCVSDDAFVVIVMVLTT